MKALTIRQPWASLIALGVKTIETRSWRAPQSLIGQTIAIHAGKWQPEPGNEYGTGWWWHDDCGDPIIVEQKPAHGWNQAPAPLGAIVATATLADCLPMVDAEDYEYGDVTAPHLAVLPSGSAAWWYASDEDQIGRDVSGQVPYGDFQPGRWAWMLTDVQPCDPVPAKGKQGLWNWDGA